MTTRALICLLLFISFAVSDVPVIMWSEKIPISNSFQIGETLSTSNIVSILKPLISSKPEVLVLFVEPVQTFQVSLFSSPSSIFSKLEKQTQTHPNSLTIPFASIDSTFINSIAQLIDGSEYVFFSGLVEMGSFTDNFSRIKNFKELEGNQLFSNGKTDILVVELNHEQSNNLESKFDYSGKIFDDVINVVTKKSTNNIFVYAGNSQINENNIFSTNSHSKRFISDVQAILQDIPDANVTQPAWFNKWFPGWFWELLAVFLVFVLITLFGACQLSQIQGPSKIPNPKVDKAKKGQ